MIEKTGIKNSKFSWIFVLTKQQEERILRVQVNLEFYWRQLMKKEDILALNQEDNRFSDEREIQANTRGYRFVAMVLMVLFIALMFFKQYVKQPYEDVIALFWMIPFGAMAYQAYITKNKTKAVAAGFCFLFALYYFCMYIMRWF